MIAWRVRSKIIRSVLAFLYGYVVCYSLSVLDLVSSVLYAKRLARKNVYEMTCFVSSGTKNLNSVRSLYSFRNIVALCNTARASHRCWGSVWQTFDPLYPAPFTRCIRLFNRLFNRFDNRLYRVGFTVQSLAADSEDRSTRSIPHSPGRHSRVKFIRISAKMEATVTI